ncbi:MAG: glycosyltransferase [Anaerolineaceae bacterium]|nr:glycosyltransferase [Anaerolineaceae bacterium]
MRIFQVLENSTNQSIQQNLTWFRNLYEPLVEMGHDIVHFPAELGRQALRKKDSRLREKFGEQLLSAFHTANKEQHFDLFFAYLMDGMIDTDILAEIHRSGVPMVNFSCNNIHQFDLVDEISPYFDLNLYAEKDAAIKFERIRAKAMWWPMASNPVYFHPVETPLDVDVSFVGANYALRAEYIYHLLDSQIDVQVFGPRWILDANQSWKTPTRHIYYALRSIVASDISVKKSADARLRDYLRHVALNQQFSEYLHDPISDDGLIRLYSRSQISLGFLEVYEGHDPGRKVHRHMHLREFEAPMCGALYCTGYSDELAEMFEPDKEVLTYRSKEEMLDKVRFYLANPKAADRIRQAGLKRALSEHTYQKRFQTLFTKMKLVPHA